MVLHLLRACVAQLKDPLISLTTFKYVHFVKSDEFKEVIEFQKQVENEYGIQIQLFGTNFKAEVKRLIDD